MKKTHLPYYHYEDFIRMCQGEPWQEPSEYKRLRELAEQYCLDTENYDRTVCTGPVINGAVMPSGPEQRGLIAKHANDMFSRLSAQARDMGFRSSDLMDQIQAHRRDT